MRQWETKGVNRFETMGRSKAQKKQWGIKCVKDSRQWEIKGVNKTMGGFETMGGSKAQKKQWEYERKNDEKMNEKTMGDRKQWKNQNE